ncbi:1,4-alpha-glucan branching protein GlgB [Desulfofustis limnaeus]|jgi:1,4-alpha-glucan branching enzyme|uniref:1,4-alpha-glucan branching enzyme GlgB n=1 Tax=Desulfofustis limnaeus TaxID=2740163 RepID=A0ABN6M2I4_9BACT|nr:1,4-alpha-glucan branching protein GlgB [Desulfofustis limnaeus]MDX9894758.1 1,4-alpha-glucan branching protein GlgB [Desulfofustis sp.]BDD87098.1 1,4-alpha-glucan branching enzyme GlgB [Desulfofustis limnaeus]
MTELALTVLAADHYDPFQFLGAHGSSSSTEVVFRTLQPQAEHIDVCCGERSFPMQRVHDDGLFSCTVDRSELAFPDLDPFDYRYRIIYRTGVEQWVNDPYRFPPLLSDQDRYLFNFGTNYSLYNILGAQLGLHHRVSGTLFRVWAPNARAVSVIGHFNGWDRRVHQMRVLGSSGIWELFIPGVAENELYRFSIRTADGSLVVKSDPFQFFGELRPNTASVVRNLNRYQWHDDEWLQQRRSSPPYTHPLAIYEVHPGSWRRDPAHPERFLTFRELADQLIPYVQELGFTHIELLPVMEHPLDESWGYQVTGPFSLTSRYGVPDDFMYFVDRCHQNGIGVILDWVPAHFPRDSHSLIRFDGTALYEHEDPRKGAHPEWGTLIYNYGRREVSNFLIANALFWLDKYHVDGLRVDAVASMLYLDYSRRDDEWVPNCYGGRENLEAIEFIRHMNSIIYDRFPDTLMLAEESTSFYGVSKPADQGGLGFGFKWNMGWMNDILSYFSKDPLYRKFHHNALTFSLMYAFSEQFILPLSHDEVVHGKRSLLEKMPGDDWQKFANLRLLLLNMYLHPGKKLLFMGGEFGQRSEWYCKRSLDWHLPEQHRSHRMMVDFVRDLNRFYRAEPSLWQLDYDYHGFSWLDLEDMDNSIISFVRYGIDRRQHLVCLLNFTPQTLYDYRLGLPNPGDYQLVFCSDWVHHGGSGAVPDHICRAVAEPHARAGYHTRVTVPPLAGIVLKPLEGSP